MNKEIKKIKNESINILINQQINKNKYINK